MIISKDLFIFGEQIFATIIPEGGTTTSTTTATNLTSAAATAAGSVTAAVIELKQQQQENPFTTNSIATKTLSSTTTTALSAATAVATTKKPLTVKTAVAATTATDLNNTQSLTGNRQTTTESIAATTATAPIVVIIKGTEAAIEQDAVVDSVKPESIAKIAKKLRKQETLTDGVDDAVDIVVDAAALTDENIYDNLKIKKIPKETFIQLSNSKKNYVKSERRLQHNQHQHHHHHQHQQQQHHPHHQKQHQRPPHHREHFANLNNINIKELNKHNNNNDKYRVLLGLDSINTVPHTNYKTGSESKVAKAGEEVAVTLPVAAAVVVRAKGDCDDCEMVEMEVEERETNKLIQNNKNGFKIIKTSSIKKGDNNSIINQKTNYLSQPQLTLVANNEEQNAAEVEPLLANNSTTAATIERRLIEPQQQRPYYQAAEQQQQQLQFEREKEAATKNLNNFCLQIDINEDTEDCHSSSSGHSSNDNIVRSQIATTIAAAAAEQEAVAQFLPTTPTNTLSSTSSTNLSSQFEHCSSPLLKQAKDTTTTITTTNMEKVMLANNERSDHAMVTFPFMHEQHRSIQLAFQNVNVLHNGRKILNDVSGLVSPGEVLAIMGPSGSGKTTLLDCLSGQRHIDSGSIQLNREPLSKKWRRKIGYVLQEEIFFTSLTLRETVMYTALLRLPDTMPKTEKISLVDRILDMLELNFCQHTKFGDYLNRGLSGGEKKRANIACELLTNPLLMLLDEPTSGLDSHSAINLMKVLKRFAMEEQKTVVITVHQPSSQMFHMFDKLLLLYDGRTAYFGEVNNIYSYFEDIGVTIKPHYNPADFVLEQLKSYPDIREKLFVAAKESHGNFLNRNCIAYNTQTNHHIQHHHHHHKHDHNHDSKQHQKQENNSINLAEYHRHHHHHHIENEKTKQHDSLINDILHNYYNGMHNKNSNHISHDAMLMLSDHPNESSCEEASQKLWCAADSQSSFSSSASSSGCHSCEDGRDWLDYPTRFSTQFRVLSSRNFKEAKPRMLSKLNWFQTIGLALMAGAIWFQLPRTEEFLHDLQGWMFFSQTYWMLFALFGALNSFPSEREVISKERRSGAYRLSAYYLAKMCGELPLVITLPTVYLLISYPMLGCTSFKLFFLMLVFLLLNTIVAQSVGFFIGACCMDMNVSITLSALYTLATQLFGGYLSSRIPEGLSWIRFTSMIHYAYQNMQILEFREGPAIRCGNPSSYEICKNHSTTNIPYDEILKAQNSTSPLWLNTLILLMFFFVFRGLGYAVLRFLRCPKTR